MRVCIDRDREIASEREREREKEREGERKETDPAGNPYVAVVTVRCYYV